MPLNYAPRNLRSASSPKTEFGEIIYEPEGTCGPRIQTCYQLVGVLRGEARVRVDQRVLVIEAGYVGLFTPGRHEHFRFSSTQRTHHTWCSMQPELLDQALAKELKGAAEVIPMTPRLAQLIELGLALPRVVGEEAPGLVDRLGLTALEEYRFSAGHPGRIALETEPMRRALDWIGQNLNQPVNLTAFALAAGVSRTQLVKLFNRQIGISPLRYVWCARTERAVQLLRRTGLTVSEIAYQCGFATPFHLSRWVRRLHGQPPRALRKAAWTRAASPRAVRSSG